MFLNGHHPRDTSSTYNSLVPPGEGLLPSHFGEKNTTQRILSQKLEDTELAILLLESSVVDRAFHMLQIYPKALI